MATKQKSARISSNQKVIDAINSLKDVMLSKQNGNGDYVTVIDVEGVTARIEKGQFFQMLHTNVTQLKKESSEIIIEVSKLSKAVNDDINKYNEVELKVKNMEKSMPRTFNSWVKDKGDTAKNIVFVLKLIMYILVGAYLVGQAWPKLVELAAKLATK